MFEKELEIAQKAVSEAMRITKTIQGEHSSSDAITKSDKSPVTIADFTSQAVICQILKNEFPAIPIVGEEDSAALKGEENKEVLEKIYVYIDKDPGVKEILNKENLFSSIDLGGDEPNDQLFWTLDPIDGTKGFLRGEQYAIALGLIEAGKVKLGVLGCPNLEIQGEKSSLGYLLTAIRGQGARLLNVETGQWRDISTSQNTNPADMRFVESYESSHSNQDMQSAIVKGLAIGREPVRMDSQVKYAVVSSGNAEIYLRIPNPKSPNYKEKIWDHAAGSIVVEEAGGVVSDVLGKPLDFGAGKTLKNNTGVAASVPAVHSRLIEVIAQLTGTA